MKYLSLIALSCFTLMACVANPATSMTIEPNVLIMGEDWDEDTIPRKSQIFERVIDAVAGQLNKAGFKVIDETMATNNSFAQGRVRRTNSDLFKIAKAIQTPPIDAVITFKIYPYFKADNTTTWMNARATGRLLNVSTNAILGTFEVTLPEEVTTEHECHKNRACALKYMGNHSRNLGQELGSALAIKLRRAAVGNVPANASARAGVKQAALMQAYKFTFDNFDASEFNQIEEYLVAFSGYDTHKIIQNMSQNSVVWYETKSDDARLKRNLRKMLDFIGVEGQVNCVRNTCTITKI
jgi:hypothetical protein